MDGSGNCLATGCDWLGYRPPLDQIGWSWLYKLCINCNKRVCRLLASSLLSPDSRGLCVDSAPLAPTTLLFSETNPLQHCGEINGNIWHANVTEKETACRTRRGPPWISASRPLGVWCAVRFCEGEHRTPSYAPFLVLVLGLSDPRLAHTALKRTSLLGSSFYFRFARRIHIRD